MSLPKIKHPTFEVTIPSTKKVVMFRPFLTKEEKILLIAKESGVYLDILRAINQIITNCCTSKINVDDLTIFDVEYIFIKLRGFSISNMAEPTYTDKEDNKQYTFKIDFNKIEVKYPEDKISKNIAVDENITVEMKYPVWKLFMEEEYSLVDNEELFDFILRNCLETIHTKDKSYDVKISTPEEINEFIEQLPVTAFNSIKEFLLNLPRVEYIIKFKNSLDHDREIVLSSLKDFFPYL